MDQRIICTDCSAPFTFSEAAQQRYKEHQFQSPKRCKACRESKPKTRKVSRQAQLKRREPEIIRLRPMLSST